MSGNRHVHRELHKNRRAFGAHSDVCEWPNGCDAPALWYYTSVRGRFSLCDAHCPVEYRTEPIAPTEDIGQIATCDPAFQPELVT